MLASRLLDHGDEGIFHGRFMALAFWRMGPDFGGRAAGEHLAGIEDDDARFARVHDLVIRTGSMAFMRELGAVAWQRKLEPALDASRATGRPVLLLFQEVPG